MRRYTSRVLSALIDVVVVNGAYLIAMLFIFGGDIPGDELQNYFDIAVLATLFHLIALYYLRIYDRNFLVAGLEDFVAVVKGSALGSVLVVAGTFYSHSFGYSRLAFAYAFVLALLLLFLWRFLLRVSFELGWRKHLRLRRVVLIGDGERVRRMAERLTADYRYGYDVAGILGITEEGSLGRYQDLCEVFNRLRFDEVVIATIGAPIKELLVIFEMTVSLRLPCRVLPGLYELLMARAPVTHLGEVPLMELPFRPPRSSAEIIKRVFDVAVALPLSVITLPLIVACGLAIRLNSPGPMLFNRQRVGLHGKEFIMFKLRTMLWDPDRPLDLTLDANDARITTVGRWLRRWSVDELPQLWNVLLGEMSLVGPRPEIAAVVETYTPWQRSVLTVKPGITGLAQVSGRDELSIPEKLHLDIFYSRNYSLALDLKIMLKTIWVVLSGKGVR